MRTKIAQFFNALVIVILIGQFVAMLCGGFGMLSGLPINTANAISLFSLLGFIPAMLCHCIADIAHTDY